MASTASPHFDGSERPGRVATEAAEPAIVVKKNRAKPYLILGAIVSTALVVYAVVSWMSRGKESTDDAQIDADAVTVSTRVAGAVLKVHVADNQQVNRGSILAEIDPADLSTKEKETQAELAAAKAQAQAADAQVAIVGAMSKGGLFAARAQLSGSTTSLAGADAQIESAKASVAHAQAEASRADTELARATALIQDQAIPRAQVDAAQSNAQAAHAAVAQARAQLVAAEDMKGTARTRIGEAQGHVEQSAPIDAQIAAARANAELANARVDAAQAALETARLQLSYTRIQSPSDGILTRLAVHEGQLVQAGQQVVVVVPNATYVLANFKETQVGQMRPGQRAEITVDAFPGRKFEGRVDSTSPGTGARFSLLPPDNASGNFIKVVQRMPVKVVWTDVPPDVKLSAGLSADVTVFTR